MASVGRLIFLVVKGRFWIRILALFWARCALLVVDFGSFYYYATYNTTVLYT